MGNSGSLGKNEINYELIGMAQKVESKYEESLAEFRPLWPCRFFGFGTLKQVLQLNLDTNNQPV